MKKIIAFATIIIVVLSACRVPEQYSDIPEIKLISFEKLNEEEALLTFYFQDGEGDIGLSDSEIAPPYDYNFFCDYYEKQNGVFVKIDSVETPKGIEPYNFNGRIPRLSSLPKESINGIIYHTITPSFYNIFSPYNDTIQLKFFIVDRKLNKSNVEEANMIRSSG